VTGPTLAFLLLFLASCGILFVLGIGLFRNTKRLIRAVGGFSDAAMPLVDEISAGVDAASRHAERLSAAASRLRSRG
jgi:hypothetical protein